MVGATNTFTLTQSIGSPADWLAAFRGASLVEGNIFIYDPTILPAEDSTLPAEDATNDQFLKLIEDSDVLDFWKTDADDVYTSESGEPIR
jgi:hypothetical protein